MSMSMHVVGIRPPDEKWTQMKKVWDACRSAGVAPPEEVEDFFNGEEPDDKGVPVELKMSCVTPYRAEMQEGFEVDVSKLPKDVKIVRFVCSW